jgi:hypothetical protein
MNDMDKSVLKRNRKDGIPITQLYEVNGVPRHIQCVVCGNHTYMPFYTCGDYHCYTNWLKSTKLQDFRY